jgi:hypothetical protein
VTPFTSPPPTTDTAALARRGAAVTQASGSWTAIAAPEIISAGYQVISTIPEAPKKTGPFRLAAANARVGSFVGDIVSVKTEFTVRAVGLRHLPPEFPQ